MPSNAPPAERVVGLGQLWGAVKYFHPNLGYGDWEGQGRPASRATVPETVVSGTRAGGRITTAFLGQGRSSTRPEI